MSAKRWCGIPRTTSSYPVQYARKPKAERARASRPWSFGDEAARVRVLKAAGAGSVHNALGYKRVSAVFLRCRGRRKVDRGLTLGHPGPYPKVCNIYAGAGNGACKGVVLGAWYTNSHIRHPLQGKPGLGGAIFVLRWPYRQPVPKGRSARLAGRWSRGLTWT